MVWKSFEKFVDANIGPDQVGVLIAWNGEGCDLRWLYKLAQAQIDHKHNIYKADVLKMFVLLNFGKKLLKAVTLRARLREIAQFCRNMEFSRLYIS